MKRFKIISVVSLALFFVMAMFGVAKFSSAHGGNTDLVHTCVLNLTGVMRSVGASTNCVIGETALDFPKEIIELPFICTNCPFNATFPFDERNGDFANAILRKATFESDLDITGWNFTNAKLEYIRFYEINEIPVDLTGVNFTNANLTGAVGMDTEVTLSGVTWSNTICPDGTNSNSHSNTCEGHLTP